MKILEKKRIPRLLKILSGSYRVIVPQRQNKETVFEDLDASKKIVLGYKTTILSLKQYFLPPEEILFRTRKGKPVVEQLSKKKTLLFGLSVKDLEAISQLDEIMSKPEKDFFYLRRREQSILIGLANHSIPSVPPLADIIFEKINESQYKVMELTPAGRKIAGARVFREIEKPIIRQYEKAQSELDKILLDPELAADAVAWSKNHSIWDRLEKICLGCGICTYVCPLCYCFSMKDEKEINGDCSRCRYWDACTLEDFAKIGGGKNFRPTLKIRYYDWFYHKFVRAYKEYGKAQCVACGRCQKYCPAGIDIEKVLLEIIRDYKKADLVE